MKAGKTLHFLRFFLPAIWLFPPALSAQQHEPDLQWKVLRTEHFDVLFPHPYQQLARRVAHICEEVYEPVSRSLHYRPHRTRVVLHTRSDVSNGFVSPFPWRMELFLTEPQENWMGSRDSWLRLLITHEFTHVVQFRKVRGLTWLSYPLFGQFNSFWQGQAPNWFIEGFATLNETRFTAGGRGRNPHFFMQMAAPLLRGSPWRLSNTSFESRKRLPTSMRYLTGYYLSDLIRKRYGEDAWARILDRYSAWPAFGFFFAMKKVTGRSAGALYHELQDSLRSQVKTTGGFHPPAGRILLPPDYPEFQLSFRWENDSTLLVYRTGFDELPEIDRVSLDSGKRRILQRRLAQAENVLTLGRGKIYWSARFPHPRFDATEPFDLEVFDLQQKTRTRLTHGARVTSPDFSRAAGKLVAVQNAPTGNRLVQIDGQTGALQTLLEVPGWVFLNPRWSPDGRRIAFAAKDSSGRQDIAILEVQSGRWRLAHAADIAHDNNPCWTPDGRFVLYASDRSGVFNIWALEVNSGRRWMVTNDSLGVFSPQVSPSGRLLACARYTDKGFLLAVRPLARETWLPEAQIESNEVSPRPSSFPAPKATAFRILNYHALPGVLVPQGWFPVAVQDEGGTAFGLFMVSQDALHRHLWQGFVAAGPQSRRLSWDVLYRYQRWWPALTLRHSSRAEAISFRGYSGYWRKSRLEAEISIPLLTEKNVYTTRLQPYFSYMHEDRRRSRGRILPRFKHYRGMQIGLRFSRFAATRRDVVPHSAIAANVFGEWTLGIFGNEFTARQVGVLVNSYLPALWRHHALQLFFGYHARRGNFFYEDIGTHPVGYGDSGFRQQVRIRAAYHLPLAYVEFALPFPWSGIYFDDLGGNVFFDWGTGWNHGSGSDRWFQNDRWSAGAEIRVRINALQVYPATAGIRYFYRSLNRDWRFEGFLQVSLF